MRVPQEVRTPEVWSPAVPSTSVRPASVPDHLDTEEIDLVQDQGRPAAIGDNVARMLAKHPDWRGGPSLDTYGNVVVWPTPLPEPLRANWRKSPALVKADFLTVQAWCVQKGLRVAVEHVEAGTRAAASHNRSDALINWVNALPAWDGTPRLDTWLHMYLGCPDDAYHRMTGRSWLRACIERALEPGLLVDVVPVMAGLQNAGKNYALTTLFENSEGPTPWWAVLSAFNPDKPDLKRLAISRWILHDDEFQAATPRLVESIKSWVSQTSEQYVAKYENDLTTAPRRALLVCSTNQSQFLYDQTGNRRFWTWAVGQIDIAAIRRDRLQLFAEAKESVPWREGLDSLQIETESCSRLVVDPLQEQLLMLVRDGKWVTELSSAEISNLLGVTPERADQSFASRLGRAMNSIGATTKRLGRSSNIVRTYSPPQAAASCSVIT
jgi:hypothetical protein